MKKTSPRILMLMVVITVCCSGFTEIAFGPVGNVYANETELTREEIVVSRLQSVFTQSTETKRSEALSKGSRHANDITLLLKEAVRNYDSWSKESQEYLDMFLKRPNDTTNTIFAGSDRFYLPPPIQTFEPGIATYPSIGGKFKFWYVDHTTPDASGNIHAATLDYVKSMASAFDAVYQTTITDMGYPVPPDDSTVDSNGGDSKMDIYIMDCGAYFLYGYAVPDLNQRISPSFMVMDNDFSEFTTETTSEEEAMQVTAAHEYHHVVQFGINLYTDDWIIEATSTWMEDQVFDDIDDNLQYLNTSTGFFPNPHRSLDSSFQLYNSWIWLEYMETNWGQDSVKSIWVDYLSSTDSSYTAVSDVLHNEGSTLRQAFSEFAKVNYTQKDFYANHQDYIPVNITNEQSGIGYNLDHSSDTSDTFETQSISLDHLAAKYFKLTPGSSLTSEEESLIVYINGTDGRKIDVIPVVVNSDQSFTEPTFTLNTSNNGTLVIDNFTPASIQEVVLVLVNYSIDENNSGFDIRGELKSNGSSGGCFIGSLKH